MLRRALKKMEEAKKTVFGISAGMRARQLLKKAFLLSLADLTILPKRVLCISIGRGKLSIACGIRSFIGTSIRGFRAQATPGEYPSPDEVAKGATSFMNFYQARKYELTLSLPKEWVVAKTVDLPLAVRENLRGVVVNEMDRLTPFEPGEAYFDFLEEPFTAGGSPRERIRVLVAAVRSDLVSPYLKALESRNIRPEKLTANFFNLGSLLAFREKKATAVFVDIEEAGYEAALVVNGTVRAGYAGAFTDEAGSDEMSRMGAIVKGTSILKRMAPSGKVPEIVLHAGYQAGSMLELPEPAVTPPFRVLAGNDWGLKIRQPGTGPAPAAALGGIVPAAGFNLFRRGSAENRRPPRALTLLLLAVIACCGVFCILGPLELEKKRQEEIDGLLRQRKAEAGRIEERKREIESLGRELAVLNGYHAPGPMALEILRELTAVLPENAWLARVRIGERNVNMEGYTSGSAAEILARLEKSGTFTRAEFASPTFRDQRTNSERFAIRADLKNPPARIPPVRPAGRTS